VREKATATNILKQGWNFFKWSVLKINCKKAGGLSPASRLNHLAGTVFFQSNVATET